MDNKQSVEIGFVAGFGMLLIGLVMPMILPMLPTSTQYCIFFVGVALILMSFAAIFRPDFFRGADKKTEQKTVNPVVEAIVEFISLPDAATEAYTKLRHSLYGVAANKFGETVDGKLDWFATLMAQNMPIYGRRPPSTDHDQMERMEFNRGRFINGGKHFGYHSANEVTWIDLKIRKPDLSKFIEEHTNA